MLMPPPTLTPMERHLLLQIQTLTETVTAQLARQDRKIAQLDHALHTRDQAIHRLTETLARLLGPLDPA